MKKLKFVLLELIMFIFPVSVYALTGSVNISCGADSVAPGSNVQCTVSGTSDAVITAFEARVNISGNASVVNFTKADDAWHDCSTSNDKQNISGYTEETNLSGTFNIGTLTLTVSENAPAGNITVSLSDVLFSDSNFHDVRDGITGGSATITVAGGETPVTEKGLKSLICSTGGILSPQFNKSITGYFLILNSVDTTTFAIQAEAENSGDEIKFENGDTNETLDPSNITFKTTGKSSMQIYITVGTGEGSEQYNIVVTKPTTRAGRLATLTVGGQSIDLIDGKYDYSVVVSGTESFQIQATLADSENFTISNSDAVLNKNFTEARSYSIIISPKTDTSGYEENTYIIDVSRSGGSNVTPTPNTPTVNPKTGTTSAILMGIVLIASLITTLYLYKKNIEGYSQGSK